MKTRTLARRDFHACSALALAGALLISVSLQAGVTSYGIFKGRNFVQSSAGTLTATAEEPYAAYFFAQTAEEDGLVLGSVQPPGTTIPTFLSPDPDNGAHHELNQGFETLAELNAAVPNGDYAIQLFDADFKTLNATLTVQGDSYPATTGISNFAAAQQIDATQPFTLQWTTPAGVGANDYVVVEVWGDKGETRLAASSFPWESNPLPATTTSFTIPAGALTGSDLELYLLFIKVTDNDTAAIAGAKGVAGYFSSCSVGLKLAGGTGGDSTPPTLLSAIPAPQTTGVPTATPLVLSFSEPMKPSQTVTWINVPNAGAMNYVWSDGGRTLTCTLPGGFPAGTMVIWGLSAPSFTDLAGNALEGAPGGFFTTASKPVDPCEPTLDAKEDFFFALKEVSYEQIGAADPFEDGSPVASFGSFFSPAAGTQATAASVRLPTGEVRNLSVFGGKYFLQAPAASEAALDAVFPGGKYAGSVTISGANGTLALSMPAAPPVPKCLNHAAAQAIDPAADFTLQWNSFAGATGNDLIEVRILDNTGKTIYAAPDPCANPPRPLANSAMSLVLKAGLLQSGKTYDVELRFMKVSAFGSLTNPAYQGGAGFSKINHFTLKTTGGAVGGTLRIKSHQQLADGRLQLSVEAPAQQSLTLEATSDFKTWETVGSGVSGADGSVLLTDNRNPIPGSAFYRVRMP